MDFVAIDTDVCSFLLKGDSRAELYRPHLIGKVPCLALQTVAELLQWAALHRWGASRRSRFNTWLGHFRLLGGDIETCQAWAQVRAERTRAGLPISPQDAWIAACALRHDMLLLTHNSGDYANISQLRVVAAQDRTHLD
jgi:predicted nucleic acid-binding protein